jgi:hypothetical protein
LVNAHAACFAAHLNYPAFAQVNCLATWEEEEGFLLSK